MLFFIHKRICIFYLYCYAFFCLFSRCDIMPRCVLEYIIIVLAMSWHNLTNTLICFQREGYLHRLLASCSCFRVKCWTCLFDPWLPNWLFITSNSKWSGKLFQHINIFKYDIIHFTVLPKYKMEVFVLFFKKNLTKYSWPIFWSYSNTFFSLV